MPGKVLLVSLAIAVALAGCAGSTVVHEITCPSEPPPDIPDLPPRPDPPDLRDLESDRYRIEGLWEGVETRQADYRKTWGLCQEQTIGLSGAS